MPWNFLVYSAGCASTDLLAYARHSLMPDYVFPVRQLGKGRSLRLSAEAAGQEVLKSAGGSSSSGFAFHCHLHLEVGAQFMEKAVTDGAEFVREGKLMTRTVGRHHHNELIPPPGIAHGIEYLTQPVFVPFELAAAVEFDAQELGGTLAKRSLRLCVICPVFLLPRLGGTFCGIQVARNFGRAACSNRRRGMGR